MSMLAELGANLAASHGTWREQPADFDDFVQSPQHLGLPPLYPRQREAVRLLLGDDPTLVFADPLDDTDEWRRRWQMAVYLWGKGSGKDYLCSIVVCYLVHVLLCLNDPQDYFGLAPGEALDVVNVAYNLDQSTKVFFAKLKARLARWRWLRERFNIVEGGRRVNEHRVGRQRVEINGDFIEFPRNIRAWSRHAQNESYEGLNVIAWIMDEASAFLSKLKRENAEAIYQTLRTSAGSRFGLRWLGFIISYPRHADDFTMTKHREALNNPEGATLADGPAMTWEINERTRDEPRVRVRDRDVPASLANDFEDDFEEACSRYCCEPPKAREAFFRFPERLWDAVDHGRQPILDWEPCTIEQAEGDGVRAYRGVRITRMREVPKGTRLYGHGDPGLTNDSFALALAHAVPATIVRHMPAGDVHPPDKLAQLGLAPEDAVEWEVDVTRTVVDALIVWEPDSHLGLQVSLQNIEDTLLALRKRYPSIGHYPRKRHGESVKLPTLTFDHWNSALTIQRLRARKLNVEDEHWSRDFQVDIYRNARTNFYNGLVGLPDTPSITSQDMRHPGAIFELERIEFLDAIKIDHPMGGSKDAADSIVRVIQHATQHNTAGFAFGSAYGHPSAYEQHAGVIPNTRPKDKVPALNPHLKQAEEDDRKERPLGELVPSEGKAGGRRLAFGTLDNRGGRLR